MKSDILAEKYIQEIVKFDPDSNNLQWIKQVFKKYNLNSVFKIVGFNQELEDNFKKAYNNVLDKDWKKKTDNLPGDLKGFGPDSFNKILKSVDKNAIDPWEDTLDQYKIIWGEPGNMIVQVKHQPHLLWVVDNPEDKQFSIQVKRNNKPITQPEFDGVDSRITPPDWGDVFWQMPDDIAKSSADELGI